MPQETKPDAFAKVCAFYNTGNIGHDKGSTITIRYNSEIWNKCCKSIISDFRFCSAYNRKQSRFSGIRKTNKTNIGK